MVVLPKQFVATRYPGYFWNTEDKKLYSIKVTGELTPLTFYKGGTFHGRHIPAGYKISINGWRKTYPLEQLMKLTPQPGLQEIKIAS